MFCIPGVFTFLPLSTGVVAALGWNFGHFTMSLMVNRPCLQALWSEPEFQWTYI